MFIAVVGKISNWDPLFSSALMSLAWQPRMAAETLWHKLHIERKWWRLTICYELMSA
jgi:hypothetical protein